MRETEPDTTTERAPERAQETAPDTHGSDAPSLPWYTLALILALADQGTKLLASHSLDYATPVPVFPWFNLTLHHNEGAAFSFLSDAGGWQRWFFAALAAAVSAVIAIWIRQLQRGQLILTLGLALVLAGAVGNLIDRVRLGYVVDFISVHYGSWYFPTFNLADSVISIGAVLIVLDSLRGSSANTEN